MIETIKEFCALLFIRCVLPFLSDGNLCDLVQETAQRATVDCIAGHMRGVAYASDVLELVYAEMRERGLIHDSEHEA